MTEAGICSCFSWSNLGLVIGCQSDAASVLQTYPLHGAGSAFSCSWLLLSPHHQSHLTGRCSNRNWLLLRSSLKLSRRTGKLDLTSRYCTSTGYTLRAVMQEKYLFQAVSRRKASLRRSLSPAYLFGAHFPFDCLMLTLHSTASFPQFFLKDILKSATFNWRP